MIKLWIVFPGVQNICLFKELSFCNKYQFNCHKLFQKYINIQLLQ
jgi:hypothetical protein